MQSLGGQSGQQTWRPPRQAGLLLCLFPSHLTPLASSMFTALALNSQFQEAIRYETHF